MNATRFTWNATLVGNGSFNTTRGGWQQQEDSDIDWATFITVREVIWYSALVLGIPGNILSATVWLRYHDVTGSSSVIYLAVLAIVNLLYLASRFLCLYLIGLHSHAHLVLYTRFWLVANYLVGSAGILQPVLLLSFSVERLIAVLRPLKVRFVRIVYRSSQTELQLCPIKRIDILGLTRVCVDGF